MPQFEDEFCRQLATALVHGHGVDHIQGGHAFAAWGKLHGKEFEYLENEIIISIVVCTHTLKAGILDEGFGTEYGTHYRRRVG